MYEINFRLEKVNQKPFPCAFSLPIHLNCWLMSSRWSKSTSWLDQISVWWSKMRKCLKLFSVQKSQQKHDLPVISRCQFTWIADWCPLDPNDQLPDSVPLLMGDPNHENVWNSYSWGKVENRSITCCFTLSVHSNCWLMSLQWFWSTSYLGSTCSVT